MTIKCASSCVKLVSPSPCLAKEYVQRVPPCVTVALSFVVNVLAFGRLLRAFVSCVARAEMHHSYRPQSAGNGCSSSWLNVWPTVRSRKPPRSWYSVSPILFLLPLLLFLLFFFFFFFPAAFVHYFDCMCFLQCSSTVDELWPFIIKSHASLSHRLITIKKVALKRSRKSVKNKPQLVEWRLTLNLGMAQSHNTSLIPRGRQI